MSPRSSRLALVLATALALVACKSEPPAPVEPEVTVDPLPTIPEAVPAEVAPEPTQPRADDGSALGWTPAGELKGVQVLVNRDSALLLLPEVAGVRDYRVFVLAPGVRVSGAAEGREQVSGAALHCAGYRQHNTAFTGSLELLRIVELTDLRAPARVVVEAVDEACPFPGVRGAVHADFEATLDEIPVAEQGTYSVYTEQEQVARYGSLIINGHGPGAKLGQPAAATAPRVLARTTLHLTPRPAEVTGSQFFDDFLAADPPRYVGTLEDFGRSQRGKRFQNSSWNFYSYGAEHTQVFIDRGQLHTVLADWRQDIFSTNIAVPRRPAQLHDTSYLHVTYEVASNATARRYWWFFLCGAEQAGQTLDAEGALLGNIVQTPFFYQPDGRNPSIEGWNCLQLFPRDGWPFELGGEAHPESDVRVMVNVAGSTGRDGVRNVSPDQYGNPNIASPGWFRQQRGTGPLGAPILDDQMLVAPRTRFDLYVRRDRVVMYVNGEQRLCNDFPSQRLTMAEAAVGFGQVLYHSAAERLEFSVKHFDRTGQRYYLTNTPFLDARSWDNLGFQEQVAAPTSFDEAACYVHR